MNTNPSLGLNLVMIFVGFFWSFVAMPRVLYAAAAVIPRFSEIQDLTKLETSHLLYIVLRSPVVWLAFSGVLLLAVNEFFPECLPAFLLGFTVSLFLLIVECYRARGEQQGKFLDELKKEILTPLKDPLEKFPPFSPRQMRMANWRTTGTELTGYKHLTYECAVCLRRVKLKDAKVCFRGNRNRFIVECNLCREPSVIRVSVSLFSEPEVITEARMPEHRTRTASRRREEKRALNTPAARAP